jgi:hypothetical protein
VKTEQKKPCELLQKLSCIYTKNVCLATVLVQRFLSVVISEEGAKFVMKNKQKSKQIDVKYKNNTVLSKRCKKEQFCTWYRSIIRYPSVLRIVV